MSAGHEVDENVLSAFKRPKFVEEITGRQAAFAFAVRIGFWRKDGLTSTPLEKDGVILNTSHRRVPPQTGQVDRPEHVIPPPVANP